MHGDDGVWLYGNDGVCSCCESAATITVTQPTWSIGAEVKGHSGNDQLMSGQLATTASSHLRA